MRDLTNKDISVLAEPYLVQSKALVEDRCLAAVLRIAACLIASWLIALLSQRSNRTLFLNNAPEPSDIVCDVALDSEASRLLWNFRQLHQCRHMHFGTYHCSKSGLYTSACSLPHFTYLQPIYPSSSNPCCMHPVLAFPRLQRKISVLQLQLRRIRLWTKFRDSNLLDFIRQELINF